jgi:hypothetical protein
MRLFAKGRESMKRYFVLGAGLLLLTGLACSVSDLASIAGGDDSSTISESGGDVLFSDDFSSSSSGWEVGSYETGTVGYGNGAYVVTANGLGDTMWGVANRSFDNIAINVEARQIRAPSNDNNDYGVVCRLQPNGNGYFFLISGDGFYAILRADDDDFVPLIDWDTSNTIRQGNSTNDLHVICDGASLSLYVNGDIVASATDFTYRSGDLALTATSYEETMTEVHFDNLEATRP